MRTLPAIAVVLALGGCAMVGPGRGESGGAAPLRGFGVAVDEAVAGRVPVVQLRTCGAWGCHEQDVPLSISGPTSAASCASRSDAPPDAAACGVQHLPGPGPGFGYAPVPGLTFDPVTVLVTTPPGAPLPISAEVRVQPYAVCPGGGGPEQGSPATAGPTCAGATPQAELRIAADGTVSQSR